MKKKRIITLINYSSNGTFSTFILLVAFYFILSLDKISNPLNLRGEQTKISDSLLDNPLGFCGSKYRLPRWRHGNMKKKSQRVFQILNVLCPTEIFSPTKFSANQTIIKTLLRFRSASSCDSTYKSVRHHKIQEF